MKERPILFSAPMVRAILEGRKTQTRRTVKPCHMVLDHGEDTSGRCINAGYIPCYPLCPYGHQGDRLYVRESGWERPERTPHMMREGADTWPEFAYDADGWSEEDHADFKRWGFKRRPSIHMPRLYSRILLEIVSVRAERLNEISAPDCIAEGVNVHPDHYDKSDASIYSVISAYYDLWTKINGQGSWEENPWVWVVEFRKVGAGGTAT